MFMVFSVGLIRILLLSSYPIIMNNEEIDCITREEYMKG
jgi:hypothetical protein